MSNDITVKTPSIIDIISKLIETPEFDTAKLEKLMDLQERMLNKTAKDAFSADFVRMKPHLPLVIKTNYNTQTKSHYAKLEDINKVIDPILEQYGFATATKVIEQAEKSVTVKCELWHKGGHIEQTTITMPLDDRGIAGTVNKTQPHAISSSIQYAKRIGICLLLNISTGDDKDGNKDTDVVTEEQVKEINDRLDKCGADKVAFFKYIKVDSAPEILAKNYKTVIAFIEAKERANKGKKHGTK